MSRMLSMLRLFFLRILFGKDWCDMMCMFFAQRIILGKNKFEDVPNVLKAGTAEVLLESGLPELVPVTYGGTLAD